MAVENVVVGAQYLNTIGNIVSIIRKEDDGTFLAVVDMSQFAYGVDGNGIAVPIISPDYDLVVEWAGTPPNSVYITKG